MRYLLIISYNGRAYNGWQIQDNARTIQGELNHALEIVLHEKVDTVASGRTDAMVSAYMQTVHFETDKKFNNDKLVHSLNGILDKDIRVLSVAETTVHARYSAKKKTYLYKMYISNIDLPLYTDALRISPNLDFKAMKKFITMLKGTNDFAGFKSSGSEVKDNVRTIYKTQLVRDGMYLYFYITGNGFLYKMVRNIVGTMLKLGEGKLDLNELKRNLFNGYKSNYTAKPEYLYLLNVMYD